MTWRAASEATEETHAFCFFESFHEGKSFITPDQWYVTEWRRHSHPANELMLTHFWGGNEEPKEFPSGRIPRVDPLKRG